MFTLCYLDLSAIKSCADLKAVFKRLSSDITGEEYDVGSNVRVHTTEDLDELWAILRKLQSNVTISCDGLSREADLCVTTTATATTSGGKRKDTMSSEVTSKEHVKRVRFRHWLTS